VLYYLPLYAAALLISDEINFSFYTRCTLYQPFSFPSKRHMFLPRDWQLFSPDIELNSLLGNRIFFCLPRHDFALPFLLPRYPFIPSPAIPPRFGFQSLACSATRSLSWGQRACILPLRFSFPSPYSKLFNLLRTAFCQERRF